MQKLFDRDYKIPAPQTAEEVIGYYARRIAQDVKLPSQFAVLAPKVREFLSERALPGPPLGKGAHPIRARLCHAAIARRGDAAIFLANVADAARECGHPLSGVSGRSFVHDNQLVRGAVCASTDDTDSTSRGPLLYVGMTTDTRRFA